MAIVDELAGVFHSLFRAIEKAEYQAVGYEALLAAATTFDPARRVPLKAHLRLRVQLAMREEIRRRRLEFSRHTVLENAPELAANEQQYLGDHAKLRAALAGLKPIERDVVRALAEGAGYRDLERKGIMSRSQAHRVHRRALSKLRRRLGLDDEGVA